MSEEHRRETPAAGRPHQRSHQGRAELIAAILHADDVYGESTRCVAIYFGLFFSFLFFSFAVFSQRKDFSQASTSWAGRPNDGDGHSRTDRQAARNHARKRPGDLLGQIHVALRDAQHDKFGAQTHLTIEEPVEYELQGNQSDCGCGRKLGLSCDGLSHILRQDPNVIHGRRNPRTGAAEIAIRAALTGNLVFSTNAHERRAEAPSRD